VARRETATEDARLLAEHHIAGVRYTRRGRRINELLHPIWGWISPRRYYLEQKAKEYTPYLVAAAAIGFAIDRLVAIVQAWRPELEEELRKRGLTDPLSGILSAALNVVRGIAGAVGTSETLEEILARLEEFSPEAQTPEGTFGRALYGFRDAIRGALEDARARGVTPGLGRPG